MSLLQMSGVAPPTNSQQKSPMKKKRKKDAAASRPQQQQQKGQHQSQTNTKHVMTNILHQRAEHFDGNEQSRLSARYLQKFAKLIESQPPGFQRLLEKMLRAMFLRRPINVYTFFADFLEAELDRRTLAELQFGSICYEVKREVQEGAPPPSRPPPPRAVGAPPPKEERIASPIPPPPAEPPASPPPFFAGPEPEPEVEREAEAEPEPEQVKEASFHDMFLAEPEPEAEAGEKEYVSPVPAGDEPEMELRGSTDSIAHSPSTDEPDAVNRESRQSSDSISQAPGVDEPERASPPEPKEEAPEEEPLEEELMHIESEHADCSGPRQFSRPDRPPTTDDPAFYDPDFEDDDDGLLGDDDDDCGDVGGGGEQGAQTGDQGPSSEHDFNKTDEGDQGGEGNTEGEPFGESQLEKTSSSASQREGKATEGSPPEFESAGIGEEGGLPAVTVTPEDDDSAIPDPTVELGATTAGNEGGDHESAGEGNATEEAEVTLADDATAGDGIFMADAETEKDAGEVAPAEEEVAPEFSPEEPITIHSLLAPAPDADDGEGGGEGGEATETAPTNAENETSGSNKDLTTVTDAVASSSSQKLLA